MITVSDAITFLKKQDPLAVLDVGGDAAESPDVLAGPGGPARFEVERITAESHYDGTSIVVFA